MHTNFAAHQQPTPIPSFIVPLLCLILVFGLTFRSRVSQRHFFVVVLVITISVVCYTGTGNPQITWLCASGACALVFQALDFLVITDPYAKFRLIGQTESASTMPFLLRLKWCAKLVLAPRGVGWMHEPKDIIPSRPKPQSRTCFIFTHQLPSIVKLILLVDASGLVLRNHPAFQPNGPSITSGGLFTRYLNVLLFASWLYGTIQLNYKLISIAMTAVGLYRPEDWPEFMGHWSDAYTIRRFWGRVWHQQLRHLVSAPGDLVAQRWLCLARGTNASAYTKLFIAFLITGTIHQVGDYSLQHRDFWAGGSLYFFVSQAVAITVEDGIIALGKKGGIQDSGYVRILGYVWTVSWFAFSLPVWLDPCVHDGVLKGMSMSIIGGLWKGDWTGETVKFSLPLGY